MSPHVYSLYMLILKHGMTPEDIYLSCRDKTANMPRSIIVGPYGSETRPTPRPVELMRTWLYRTLVYSGISKKQGPLYPIVELEEESGELYYMPMSLASFIAKHATDNIQLTWWDRLKRWLK